MTSIISHNNIYLHLFERKKTPCLRFSIDETHTIYQEDTLFVKSFEAHTTSQTKSHVKGSSFPDLTMSAAASCNKSIWLFGGFNLRFDETTNELFCFSNVQIEENCLTNIFCQHFPGPETLKDAGIPYDQLTGLKHQKGFVPEQRMGHSLFTIGNHLILIGGHQKIWKNGKFQFQNLNENIFVMDTNNVTWAKIEIVEGDSGLLKRSLFMSVACENTIYLTGGSLYSDNEVRRFDICEILKVNLNIITKTAHLSKIVLKSEAAFISSATMTHKAGILYLFGGVEQKFIDGQIAVGTSGKFYTMNLEHKAMTVEIVQEEAQDMIKVYGSSSVWFGNHTLIIISGSRPPLGSGFRSILCYTKLENREMMCEAATCLILEKTGNVPWIQCDKCDNWIHYFCDEKIRNRKTEFKKSENYFCEKCRQCV